MRPIHTPYIRNLQYRTHSILVYCTGVLGAPGYEVAVLFIGHETLNRNEAPETGSD